MRRDDRGLALPSWLVAVCAVLVALAVVGFAVSGDRDPEVSADGGGVAAPVEDPEGGPGRHDGRHADDPRRDRAPSDDPEARPGPGPDDEPVERRTAYVEVYNNSGITGLAGETAATLQDTGWQVVATDNWYGEIPSNTVYHSDGLAVQALLLAGDLGIDRIQPAVAPMRFDRLTVILTAEV